MEKRRALRTKHRLTCELSTGSQTYSAVVRDLGPTGLFVQTRARPDANSVITVRFPATAGVPAFAIEAGVARHRNVHPRLQADVQSGIGLEILGRPADYLALASRIGSASGVGAVGSAVRESRATATPSAPPAKRDEAPVSRRFRVRLAAYGQSAPRTLLVAAASTAEARSEALARIGDGWKIVEVETI